VNLEVCFSYKNYNTEFYQYFCCTYFGCCVLTSETICLMALSLDVLWIYGEEQLIFVIDIKD
jgi:hypothetical protein